MRGVTFIVAVTAAADAGDFSRFNDLKLTAFFSLVASEYSSVQPSDAG
ncbi:hypothetical protein GA0061099_10466 [Bradyrhizobium yuanmingense]|uniref:Uncharacterized protein n=2 Tax=Nitrobacteraceae TaxID=41294 RepID=A0A1C3XL64_9BRAD|nr:hypothetical protein IQ15_07647 [Bradyrhizobium yuanmingense]SCB53003.1 hypothetical protein GA0061099_10466 [Bradyrhizobium yuanmingense]